MESYLRNLYMESICQANNVLNDQANRLKKGESAYFELQRHVDELTIEIRTSGADHERAAGELQRLKHTVSDQETKIDALMRENARLVGK